jgi:hypothetical protein
MLSGQEGALKELVNLQGICAVMGQEPQPSLTLTGLMSSVQQMDLRSAESQYLLSTAQHIMAQSASGLEHPSKRSQPNF